MEETTHYYRSIWLGLIFLYSAYLFSPFSAKAQSSQPNSKLNQLLDSAEVLKLKGDYSNAIALFNKIKSETENKKDWDTYTWCLTELGDISRYQGRMDISEKYLNKSVKIATEFLNENSIVFVRIYLYEGLLLNETLDTSKDNVADSILNYYGMSEEILRQFPNELKMKSMVFFRMAQLYNSLDMVNDAQYYFNKSIEIIDQKQYELDYQRAVIFNAFGKFYRDIGDYERAILFMNIAYYIYLHSNNNDLKSAFKCESSLANYYFYSGQYEMALKYYNQVIDEATKTNSLSNSNILSAYTNRIQPLIYLGDYDEAIQTAFSSIKLNKQKSNYEIRTLFFTYNSLAEIYEQIGDYKNAEIYFKKSLKTRIEFTGLQIEDAYDGYLYLGAYYGRTGELKKALDFYQRSLEILFNDFSSNSFYDNPDYRNYQNKSWLLYVIFYKSSALFELYKESNNIKDLQSAYDLYITGYGILDELLNSGHTDNALIDVFQRFKMEFNLSVECALELFQLTGESAYFNKAFQFIENNKYFLLYQALANSDNKFIKGVPDKLIHEQRVTNKNIIELNRILNSPISTDSSFIIRNALIDKLNMKAEIEKEIEQTGEQNKAAIIDHQQLSVNDVQNSILNEDDIIIEFHWSNASLFALIIGKDILEVHETKLNKELLESIEDYIQSISGESDSELFSKYAYKRFINSSIYLYDNILKPVLNKVEKQIISLEKIDRIIIVPDGELSYMPFESLITQAADTSTLSYWGLHYFCKEFTIGYTYSLNILKSNLTKSNQKIKPKLLGFSYSAPLKSKEGIALLRSNNELPYSSEELDGIENWIKRPDFFRDGDATEEVFKSQASNYSLLHLAIHGQADTTDMFNSRLIFKRDENSIEDGELHAYELYDMDLSNTELTVLSACETGLGKQSEGEGIFSIARGFAYAGCPSIVMSLWKVNDKTTAGLMEYFYQYLADGMNKDKALQKAKLTFIENADDLGAHPSNWAAFIAMGNNQPIQLPASNFQWVYILLIVGFIAIMVFIFRKKSIVKLFRN